MIDRHIGRYADKIPDWDAFPANRGYPELARSQIRYIGAGGSPKVEDANTLPADHFTLSIVHQPAGNYGASHFHEVEEAFLVLQGVLTVGWEWDGDVVLSRLGPKDMILHASGRPHGFRNDGNEPVLLSIMVGKGRPMAPQYRFHPSKDDPAVSRDFGAQAGRTHLLSGTSDDPRHREMARHIVRFSEQDKRSHPAGFARCAYIGEGAAPAGAFSKELILLPSGTGVMPYERAVEEAYLVLEGSMDAGWEEAGRKVERRLGPKDVLLNPAGVRHWFRNESDQDAQFMMIVGSSRPERVDFQRACR